MHDQERIFINFMEDKHPLLQELPLQYRNLWFKKFQLPDTKEYLYLQMERITNAQNQIIDLLTFEIVDVETLTEWEEEFPDKPFVASDPSIIFFDGMEDDKAMFSIGDLDRETMNFDPELEVYFSFSDKVLSIDYGDNTVENWELID